MIQPKNKREPGNPGWGGAREESKLIEKYANQWCKDNGYPIRGKYRSKCGRNVAEMCSKLPIG